ncbi:MAG: hypothetical protein IKB72_05025 [Ruminococcus sp.]|nr:hypothetical protein [Ruminococcus sp.]
MKKYLALILALIMVLSLAACGGEKGKADDSANAQTTTDVEDTPKNEYTHNEYVLSDSVEKESIVDGVMTDISAANPVLEKTTASWLDTCVLYEVNIRQYTEEGTFKAFEKHLPRLKAMGVNTLWLMPIHPISVTERKGTLGSYYAVDDYMAINPEFGTMEDFEHLVDTAHDMGFKVILDWVANHTGWDHQWITDHDDWYEHDVDGNITYPYDWNDIAELNFDKFEMRAEMIKCMQFWVQEKGIDGFRCDHAGGVPATFWNAAVYKLKSINSEIMMLAENSASEALTAYAFDSCYNDNLYNQSLMVRAGLETDGFKRVLADDAFYIEGSFPMNYTDNHDKNSYEGTIYDRFDNAYVTMFALSYVAPGMPLIYTANEQGYDHEIEFFEKDTILWDEEPVYEELITELSALKAENKALSSTNRDIEFIETSDAKFLAFSRTMGEDKVYFVGNFYYEPISDVTISFDSDNAKCVMHYDGTDFDFEDKEFNLSELSSKEFQPYEFYIFTTE